MDFADLELYDSVHRSAAAQVSRGRRRADGAPVIFKALPPAMQTPAHIARLRYEWRILQHLQTTPSPRVPEPLGLVEAPGVVGLAMGDIGGSSLRLLQRQQGLSLRAILTVATEVAKALLDVHHRQVVHKDINPNNIIYNPHTGQVQLIDFDLASQVPREVQAVDNVRVLEGTLAYISPEQTGRTHVALDYRSDFYSLGATLYDLCTGAVPFEDADVPHLVHAVLTRMPPNPRQRAPALPEVVADMILKLLRKDPEERYHSAFGLHADLAACLAGLDQQGHIAPFALGTHDRSEVFAIAQRLYGREAEIQQVLAAYAQVAHGAHVLLAVSGPSGIGKSALVNAVQGAMVEHNGLFGAGKYDQLSRHVPFSALGQALTQVVRRVLMEPEHLLDGWRRRVQEAVGGAGQAVVAIVPALELLIGPQKPLPEVGLRETENRLLYLLQRVLTALCKRQPLVLFLDDLQWADGGTLKLVQRLAADEPAGAGMFIMGAYRDNEVGPGDPLMAVLAALRDAGVVYHTLQVQPLGLPAVTALVQDTTHTDAATAAPLAAWLLTKTAGNPFLLQEFFKSLWQRDLLHFDAATGRWRWDMATLHAATVTDNVATLLTDRIAGLAASTREALCMAACMGNVFSLRALAEVRGESSAAVAAHLESALAEGLLVPMASSYRYAADDAPQDDVEYRFAHDKIQRAAYDTLAADVVQGLHLRLGRAMLAHRDTWVGEAPLLRVADHLNAAHGLLQNETERMQLASINLQAGQHARAAAAHGIAADYFQAGLALLPQDAWDTHYEVVRGLTMGLAEAEFLSGSPQAATEHLARVLQRSRTLGERVEVAKRRMRILNALSRFGEAIDAGTEALRALGARPIRHPRTRHLLRSMLLLRWALRGRSVRGLIDSPPLTDERIANTVSLWLSIEVPAFHADPNVFALTAIEVNRLIVRHGLPRQASSFGGMAMLDTLFGNYAQAKDWGYLVRAMLERDPSAPNKAVGHTVLAAFIEHLEKTPGQMAERFAEVARISLEEGVPSNAGKAVNMQLFNLVSSSIEACAEMAQNGRVLSTPGFPVHDRLLARVVLQYCRAVRGETAGPMRLDSPDLSADELIGSIDVDSHTGAAYFLQMSLAWMARDFAAAQALVTRIRANHSMRKVWDGMVLCFNMYWALTLTQAAFEKPPRSADKRHLRKALKRLRQAAAAGPQIYGGFPTLVDAELLAARGALRAAAQMYERAMKQLSTSGHNCFIAAGWECVGRFFARSGMNTAAQVYVRHARDSYSAWGATWKAQQLHQEFALLMDGEVASTVKMSQGSTKGTSAHTAFSVDVAAMLDAAQALTSERSLDRLVQIILTSVQQSAGASRAVLLLKRDDLQVVADSQLPSGAVPMELLRYCLRTEAPLVLQDVGNGVGNDARFKDPYLQQAKPKALLCVPILHQGKSVGAMYLENNVASGTFAADRLLTISFLAAQAATALENATLYAHLEDVVAQRTAELQRTHARVLQLEKDSTEMQMAGGFAHEMRNALSSVRWRLAVTIPLEGPRSGEPTTCEALHDALETMAQALRENTLASNVAPNVAAAMQEALSQQDSLQETLMALRHGVDRALTITEQILLYADVGRIHPGDHSAEVEATLAPILQACIERCAAAHIDVHAAIPSPMHAAIRAEHLRTVLQHLLDNAYDALCAAPEDRQRQLEVSTARANDHIVIEVRDTGTGIAPEAQARLFQPFFSTKGAHGVGLGLGLCKKLMQVYRGELTYTSDAQGSAFRVRLPVGEDKA